MPLSIGRRQKKSRKPVDLRKWIARKLVAKLRNQFVSVIGQDGTGRKTVLERFLNMSVGSLEDREIEDLPTRTILVDLETRPYIRRREVVNLLWFVFNLEELDFETMFFTISQLHACAVLFDVTVDPTLFTAIHCMVKLTRLLRRPPRFVLVGNKIDRPGRQVMPDRAQIISQMCGAQRYYECSALMNIDMDPVLDSVLILALREPLRLP